MNKETKKRTGSMPRWKRILRIKVWQFSKSMRLNERIALANDWGRSNPLYLFGGVIAILSLCTALSITALVASFHTVSSNGGAGPPTTVRKADPIPGVFNIQPMMNGFHNIENGKKREKMEVQSLIDRGMDIKKEIDSLQRLPRLTHDDSLRLAADYKHLKDIVDFLDKRKKP